MNRLLGCTLITLLFLAGAANFRAAASIPGDSLTSAPAKALRASAGGLLFNPALAQPPLAGSTSSPVEAEQVLFLVDNSSSMTTTAADPEEPGLQRWQLVQRLAPRWMSLLDSETLVGAVSVGGNCDGSPALRFPVGSPRDEILDAIAAASPNGGTPLNAILKSTPSLFTPNALGKKRIILLSDGLNSCAPNESTCDIVRELHRDHGITIDIVAWVTDPSMIGEFQCVASAGGGTLATPRTIKEWTNIPPLAFDPWPYVVLALGMAALFSASLILYRHAHHVLRWSPGTASLIGSLLLVAGGLALYLVLFARGSWPAALFGLAVIGGVVAVVAKRSRPSYPARVSAPWSFVVAGLVLLGLSAIGFAQNLAVGACVKAVKGYPRYHHILALDMSGTVARHFDQMKALLACYAEMYTLPGEEVTLLLFGVDEHGSAQEWRTFTVSTSGSTSTLGSILDDLRIQNPKQTMTYFKPLADLLQQQLQKVHLQPVVLVLSDGVSDGFESKKAGLIDFQDVPFESFGVRGVYAAPGVSGWKVAVQGGAGLDLTALFQKPMAQYVAQDRKPQPLRPVIEPCLVDPPLVFEHPPILTLKPILNPFSNQVMGSIEVQVHNECVSRFRTFRFELRRGSEVVPLGAFTNRLITTQSTSLLLKVSAPAEESGDTEAVIQLMLDQGGTERAIYASNLPTILVHRASYLETYGLLLGALLLGVTVALTTAVFLIRGHRVRQRNRPQIIKVPGGSAVTLARHQRFNLGGPGAELEVPGAPPGVVFASIQGTEGKGRLIIQPTDAFRMRMNGFDSPGISDYVLGSPLQFISANDGHSFDVPLVAGTGRDLGLAGGSVATGDLGFGAGLSGFSSFGSARPNGKESGFGSAASGSDNYI